MKDSFLVKNNSQCGRFNMTLSKKYICGSDEQAAYCFSDTGTPLIIQVFVMNWCVYNYHLNFV